jgi:tRNA 5-methylaminomethyl-2-thiouridine biosynthesis bifunctional protein
MSLQPEQLVRDANGAPYSGRYGDVYASRDGALGQARHVFLGGNALPTRWRGRDQFVVFETGFGLGTNFLATWQAWRDDPGRPRRLHYVSVEKHPLAAKDLGAASPELLGLAEELVRLWPVPLPGLHRVEFDDGRVVLTLALGDARELVPQLVLGADAIYLDGFAPDRNPEMWEPALLRAVAQRARPEATLSTWCTARPLRDALEASGFELELRQGFGHKRQMLVARYAPRYIVRRREPPAAYAGARRAMIVGAGLAGAACADALARRGWQVDVIERARKIAAGASSLPWGLLHPQFAVDDNLLARLSRAGVAAGRRALDRVAPQGDAAGRPVWRETGVFQQADDADEALRWTAALEGWPHEFVVVKDADRAAAVLGMRPRHAGLWWPEGRVVSAAQWCAALLDHQDICVRLGLEVASATPVPAGWSLAAADLSTAAGAPVLIAANALDVPRLLSVSLPLTAVRGRITQLEPAPFAALAAPVIGGGNLVRAPDGSVWIGATYETPLGVDLVAPLDDARATAGNLARLDRLFDGAPVAAPVGTFDGQRCVARDRLPLAGAVTDTALAQQQSVRLNGAHLEDLPRRAGIYACAALGSRGLTLAALLGELIACRIEGEPLPIERSLAAAVDPGRFLLRELRTGRSHALQSERTTPSG